MVFSDKALNVNCGVIMDGKVNEYYNCPVCVYLHKENDKSYCYEGFPRNVIELTSKQQCRKCNSWSAYEFDRFLMFGIRSDIKDRLTVDEIKSIWEAGREDGKRMFLHSNKFGR